MRRYILSLPADLALVDEAGNPILPGTVVCPMPGTVAVDGRILADVEAETIDLPEGVTVLACQSDSGEFVTPLDVDEFTRYLAPVVTLDESGEVIDSQPAALHQPHQMGGWPDITQPAPVPVLEPRYVRDWEFRDRFTQAELMQIIGLADGGDMTAKYLLLKIQTASDGVDLDSPEVIGGVQYVARQIRSIDPARVLSGARDL